MGGEACWQMSESGGVELSCSAGLGGWGLAQENSSRSHSGETTFRCQLPWSCLDFSPLLTLGLGGCSIVTRICDPIGESGWRGTWATPPFQHEVGVQKAPRECETEQPEVCLVSQTGGWVGEAISCLLA